MLTPFWPHEDAQRCRVLRTSEYRLGRSAVEWVGSGCVNGQFAVPAGGQLKVPTASALFRKTMSRPG